MIFLAKIFISGRLFLIGQTEKFGSYTRTGYATFDDPTGADAENRVDIAKGESSGPVRTILAFSNADFAGEYIEQELKCFGNIVRFDTSQKDIGKLFRMMLSGKIKWLTFDRYPSNRPLDTRYSCTHIHIRMMAEFADKYYQEVNDSIAKMPIWLPNDSSVIEVDGVVKRMLDNNNGK